MKNDAAIYAGNLPRYIADLKAGKIFVRGGEMRDHTCVTWYEPLKPTSDIGSIVADAFERGVFPVTTPWDGAARLMTDALAAE